MGEAPPKDGIRTLDHRHPAYSSKLETVAIATKEDDIYDGMDRMMGGFGKKIAEFHG